MDILRGRSKNLILGPSGENIYPEEIEHILDRSPWVMEEEFAKTATEKIKRHLHQ